MNNLNGGFLSVLSSQIKWSEIAFSFYCWVYISNMCVKRQHPIWGHCTELGHFTSNKHSSIHTRTALQNWFTAETFEATTDSYLSLFHVSEPQVSSFLINTDYFVSKNINRTRTTHWKKASSKTSRLKLKEFRLRLQFRPEISGLWNRCLSRICSRFQISWEGKTFSTFLSTVSTFQGLCKKHRTFFHRAQDFS